MLEDERTFRKVFYDMCEMVKMLYNERTTRLQGESSNQPKGNGGNGRKPPPSPPSSVIHENDLLIGSKEKDSLTEDMTKFTVLFSKLMLPTN